MTCLAEACKKKGDIAMGPLMNKKADHRLTNQKNFLHGKAMQPLRYECSAEADAHDHCAFCCITISASEGDLQQGYCTLDEAYWVCTTCFEDFKEMFAWELVE